MSNLHAAALEKILTARGVRIEKAGKDWNLLNGGGKTVAVYAPASGVCRRIDLLLGTRRREELRGSPQRVADILEAFVR